MHDPQTAARVATLEARADAIEARVATAEANFVHLCNLIGGLVDAVQAAARGNMAAHREAMAKMQAVIDTLES